MNNPEQIKQVLTPIIVAQHYLGQGKMASGRLWYKSPFRIERTASFMVDSKSFHDFGDSWHGDVIDFVGRYFHTDFINTMKILSRDFGLPADEPITKEVEQYLKRRREEEQQMRINLDKWFNETFGKICDELRFIEKAIPYLKQETLKIAYDKHASLSILWELFFYADSEEEKLELWKNRENIEKCLG